jgi:type VI protein secretion system component VasF
MAEPARHAPEAPPETDPATVERAYRRQRAKRRALEERRRERRRARFRFWGIVLLLLGGCVYLSLSIWHQVQHLFGL